MIDPRSAATENLRIRGVMTKAKIIEAAGEESVRSTRRVKK